MPDAIAIAKARAIARAKAEQPEPPSMCEQHGWREELAACLGVSPHYMGGVDVRIQRGDFIHFTQHWQFLNRDAMVVQSFRKGLWTGQAKLAAAMVRAEQEQRWLFALKAGKLGFTELECVYDAWVLLARAHSRVHIFSRDLTSSATLLSWVRFGLTHLPPYFGVVLLGGQRGGDTGRSLMMRVATEAGGQGDEDIRQAYAYAAGPNVSIDQVATHAHVDELSHMPFPERTWGALSTTVAPGDEELGVPPGTLHIVSRGAGDDVYSADLWHQSMIGRWGHEEIARFVAEHPDDEPPELYSLMPGVVASSRLTPLFCPWWDRPGRDRQWYEEQRATMHVQALAYFAPETPADALAGELTAVYIPPDRWASLRDQYLVDHPLMYVDADGLVQVDQAPIVLSLDAAVSGDCFGVVPVSRHPLDPQRPAIRSARAWTPPASGQIDFEDVQRFIRWLCEGGCMAGHPLKWVTNPPRPDYESTSCPACQDVRDGGRAIPKHNVVQITYDPYQLAEMIQQFEADHLAWCDAFQQGTERLEADGFMHKLALTGRLAHDGDRDLAEHVANAKAKLEADQESKMRIVKRSERGKIDLAVAASMGVWRIMALNVA